jgi:hypothetical protein
MGASSAIAGEHKFIPTRNSLSVHDHFDITTKGLSESSPTAAAMSQKSSDDHDTRLGLERRQDARTMLSNLLPGVRPSESHFI